MAKTYQQVVQNRKATPSNQPIPGSQQVPNAGGGYGWKVSDWTNLERFLILGTEGGSYYASEHELTLKNAQAVQRCLDADGKKTVETIVEISRAGRAIKNDPAIFALALAASAKNPQTRADALKALPLVCRTASQLFQFIEMIDKLRGWGRSLKRGVATWYNSKEAKDLAYQMIKYRTRNGWSHKDALILSHPTPATDDHNRLYKWAIVGGSNNEAAPVGIPVVQGFVKVQLAKSGKEAAQIIRDYKLPREAVPTEFLNDKEVWEALLEDMPMTALIRNLGKLSSIGLLVPGNFSVINKVVDQIGDINRLRKARVHPVQMYAAYATYKQGHGERGSNNWSVVPQVVDALNDGFYNAFQTVEPTGKNFMLGVDVSGSMTMGQIGGVPNMTPNAGAALMAMVIARVERNYTIKGFSHQLVDLGITAKDTLEQATKKAQRDFGATDPSLPVEYAIANNLDVDVFVIITDNENNRGRRHASQALEDYRQRTGKNAKLAAMALTAGHYSVADPDDPGMMDFVGFDTNVPLALAEFSKM